MAQGRGQLKKMLTQHKKHKGAFLKLFHVLKQHPASYRMGFTPSRGAVSKSIPTKRPAGYTKEAAGIFDWFKKRWGDVKKLFHAHKGKAMTAAKAYATAVGTRALHAGRDYAVSRGQRVISRGKAAVDSHLNHYISKAESKIRQVADRTDKFLDKHTRFGMPNKKGSGVVANIIRNIGRGALIGTVMRGVARR